MWLNRLYRPSVSALLVLISTSILAAQQEAAGKPEEESFTCKVLIWVGPSGKAQVAQVVKSSGWALLDRACLNAGIGHTSNAKSGTGEVGERWNILPIKWMMGRPARPSSESSGRDVAIPELARDQTLKLEPPYYPEAAMQQRKEGVCTVHLVVSAQGEIRKATLTQSTAFLELDNACLDVIHAARFIPARRDGQSVAAATDVWLRWRLPNEK
jgi:TonB family protein